MDPSRSDAGAATATKPPMFGKMGLAHGVAQPLLRGGAAWPLLIVLCLGACGLPAAPDVRKEMSESIKNLGIVPFYPLRETPRIGQIYLVDASTASPDAQLRPYHATNVVLTEALVPAFEARRQHRAVMRARFPQSVAQLDNQLVPADNKRAFYRQTPPASGDASPAGSLALAALPGLTLASLDQASLGASVPQALATFGAALGLRESRFVHIEADAVEVADLPLDDTLDLIRAACADPTNRLGTSAGRDQLAESGYYLLNSWWDARRQEAETAGVGTSIPAFRPQVYVLHRVYYLRGIRYVFDDSRVSGALVQAALATPLPTGATPPSLATITVNAPAPAQGTPAQTANTPREADVNSLRNEINELRKALSAGSGTQLGGSILRATSRGIELVELFDRPLAFGYEPLAADLFQNGQGRDGKPERRWMGLGAVCAMAGAP